MTRPFPTAWFSIELEGYREPSERCTYYDYDYDSLPPSPVDRFDGSFRWLPPADPIEPGPGDWYDPDLLARLSAQAAEMGFVLPAPFVHFMRAGDLPGRIRSVTDCGFELPERIVPVPWASGALVRFLADSQGCLYWYLFLQQGGAHCVVSSWESFGGDARIASAWDAEDDEADPDPDDDEPPSDEHEIHFCSPDFESFIHRFWIENEIWLALEETGGPINDEQRRYLEHYRRPPGADGAS